MAENQKGVQKVSPLNPVVDTGVAGKLPVLGSKEVLNPISIPTGELPPIKVLNGAEGSIKVIEPPDNQIPIEGITDQPKKVEIKDSSSAPPSEQFQPAVPPPTPIQKIVKEKELDHAKDSDWGIHKLVEIKDDREELKEKVA